NLLPKCCFDLLKGEVRKTDHCRSGEWHLQHGAVPQEGRQWKRATLQRRFFNQSSQTRRNPTGNKCVGVTPEIDPRFGVDRHFVDQLLSNREMAFSETFLPDWISCRVQETI